MARMERLLQVLVDAERYGRFARAVQESGRSIVAVVREAIDLRVPPGREDRVAAVDLLLRASDGGGVEPDWADVKRDLERGLRGPLP